MYYITEAGLAQFRASVGANAASVAGNEEGKGGFGSWVCRVWACFSIFFRRACFSIFVRPMFLYCFSNVVCCILFVICWRPFGFHFVSFSNNVSIIFQHKSSIVCSLILVWFLIYILMFVDTLFHSRLQPVKVQKTFCFTMNLNVFTFPRNICFYALHIFVPYLFSFGLFMPVGICF